MVLLSHMLTTTPGTGDVKVKVKRTQKQLHYVSSISISLGNIFSIDKSVKIRIIDNDLNQRLFENHDWNQNL